MKNFKIALGLILVFATAGCTQKVEEPNISELPLVEESNVSKERIIEDDNSLKAQIVNYLGNEGVDVSKEVLFFEETNLDLDENKDYVIGFGEQSKFGQSDYETFSVKGKYSWKFVVEETNGSFTHKEIENYGPLDYYGMSIVNFKEFDYPLIYCRVADPDSAVNGFDLFRYIDNEVNIHTPSASGTRICNDDIFDIDKDGVYDGYTQYRPGYDYLRHVVTKTYEAKNGEFVLSDYQIVLWEYPETPRDVVLYYYTLAVLQDYEQTTIRPIQEYLDDMSLVDVDIDFEKIDEETVANTDYQLEPYLRFTTENNVESNKAKVEVYIVDEEAEEHYQDFNLEKIEGKWKIVKYK